MYTCGSGSLVFGRYGYFGNLGVLPVLLLMFYGVVLFCGNGRFRCGLGCGSIGCYSDLVFCLALWLCLLLALEVRIQRTHCNIHLVHMALWGSV
ncbi:unnamed protein product [Cuscuta campestris]|uniref:Uncharacterized protein n=1 Tax=Cuscuta campestris TaxID=132261 RepID=A0A484NC65_9ASTE|nr:unnamed protein product [Cuscuta campestris]